MRCPECNKFVPFEQPDPEDDIQVDAEEPLALGQAHVSGSIRLALNCGECGTELAEATCDVDETVSCPKAPSAVPDGDAPAHEVGLDAVEATGTDRYEGKGRGMRHYYGAEVTANLRCSCGEEFGHSFEVEEQASSFEPLA